MLEAGAVEIRLGVTGLERVQSSAKAAERAMSDFAANAQRALDNAFSGKDIAPALRRGVAEAVDAARRALAGNLSGARGELARGLIDEREFAARAKSAGESGARDLTRIFGALTKNGLLPPDVGQRLAADLTAAARRAGERAGVAVSTAMREGVKRTPPMSAADWQIGEVSRVMAGLTGRMDTEISAAREQLFRGLIDPAEFQRRAQAAAAQFNTGLLGGISRMASRFKLPPELHQYMVAQLRDAGLKAGQEAGAGISRGLALANRLTGRAQFRFDQTTANDREALARGLISPEEFAKRGREASAAFNDSLLRGLDGLKARGLLSPDVHRQLVAQLKATGQEAARSMGGALAEGMGNLGNSLALKIAAPLTIAGGFAVREAVNMDSIRLAMESVTGSAGEAAKALERMREIARAPALSFKTAAMGATQLRVVGMSARDAERSVREFANAVARSGGGSAELARVVTQLQQMSAAGRVLSADLRPILGSASAAAGALREAFGTIDPQQIEALGLSFSEFYERWLKALEAAPRVAGGARQEFESMREGFEMAAAALGREMLPGLAAVAQRLTGVSAGVEGMNRNTAQWTIAAGGGTVAAIGMASAVGTLTAGVRALGATTALASGGATLALGAISALFIKAKLDSLEAAAAVDRYRQSLAGLEQMGRPDLLGKRTELESKLRLARMLDSQIKSLNDRMKQGGADALSADERDRLRNLNARRKAIGAETAVIEADLSKINSQLDRVQNTATGTTSAITATVSALADEVEQLRKLAGMRKLNTGEAQRLAAAEQKLRDMLSGGTLSVENELKARQALAATKAEVKEINDALRTLEGGAAVARLLGAGFATADPQLRAAAESADKLRRELEEAEKAFKALGAGAPAGTAAHVEDLRAQYAETRAEVAKLAAEWQTALGKISAPLTPKLAGGVITAPIKAFGPGIAEIEQAFKNKIGELNIKLAGKLIDTKEFEEKGREAAREFNDAILHYLATHKLEPKVRAEISTLLKVDVDGTAAWKEAAGAAATAAQGAINVGDALGELGDQSRRALTGVAQLAQGVGQLKSGPLMQLGNLPGIAGIIGSAAQIGAAIFGKQENPEEQARHRELVGALNDLAVKLGGFRATANAIRGTSEIAKALQGFKDPRAAGQMFFRMLDTYGLTLQEVVAVAKEFGVSLLNDKGQLDANKLASKEFGEILAQASKTLVGFRNTLDDQRKRQSLRADLFNEPTDAGADLAAQMALLTKFMPEFAKGLGAIDTATAEGRARLEAEIQRMFGAFEAGALNLENLTREEWLSLIEGFAGAFDRFREATDKASGALLNVPAIFDLALRRRQAALAGAAELPAPRVARVPQPIDPANRIAHLLEGLAAPAEDAGAGLADLAGLLDHLRTPIGAATAALARLGGAADAGVADFGGGANRLAGLLDGIGAPMGETAGRAAHLARAFDATATPLAGFTASVTSAWAQLDRLTTRALAVPAPPSGGKPYTPGAREVVSPRRTRSESALTVNINNPPAGMDVPRTAAMLKNALKYNPEIRLLVQRAAANQWTP